MATCVHTHVHTSCHMPPSDLDGYIPRYASYRVADKMQMAKLFKSCSLIRRAHVGSVKGEAICPA